MKKLITVFFLILCVNNTYATGFNILHPIKSLRNEIIVAGAGVVTYEYFVTHPEKLEEFLSTHPQLYDDFVNYVANKIANATSEEKAQKYMNIQNKLNLTNESLSNQVNLENDNEWQQIEQEVISQIRVADEILKQKDMETKNCNINVMTELLKDSKVFEESVNNILPKLENRPANVLDVNTYKELKKLYKLNDSKTKANFPLQQDHIPSYAAIDLFFKEHGINTNTYYKTNNNGENKLIRDNALNDNATTIAIPMKIHEMGRTYGGRNVGFSKLDSKNLLIATIKDITTTAYWIYKNPSYKVSYKDYIGSAMTVYARNKMLCMYTKY